MEWRMSYLDLVLIPLSLTFSIVYHGWLWHKVKKQPLHTTIGLNAAARHLWVRSMMKDNEKKNVLVVQTLRNTIMGSTLMATTSVLLCSALAAVLSSTYSIKKPISESVYGAHGELMVALKYAILLFIFLFAFLCYSLSIRFVNQVGFLVNVPTSAAAAASQGLKPEYVCQVLEKGFALNAIGNRLFYAGLPLLLWIFGPVLVFLCSAATVPVLYNLDVVCEGDGRDAGEEKSEACCNV